MGISKAPVIEPKSVCETAAQTRGHPHIGPPPRRSRQPTPCLPALMSLGTMSDILPSLGKTKSFL